MKKLLFSIVILFGTFLLPTFHALAVHVNGYYRSNGTYVNSYERTSPDGDPYNNYSYPGNYNPNTGSITGGNSDTYLNNYYNNSSNYYPSSYDYSPASTPSCPINSYYDGVSSCQCNYGYIVSGSSCVNADLYCSSEIGLMSEYNSSSKRCECMSGYEFDGSTCVYKSSSYTYPSSYPDTSSYSCPSYSHTSPTDATKCQCDSGFQVNATNDACVVTPPTKVAPFIVSDQQIPPPTTPTLQTPTFTDFSVADQDIEPFTASGILVRPTTFRTCPSGNCTIIKYYAETSKINIIGKYKKGAWYEVAGSTDAKGGNGTKITGWVRQSPFGEVTQAETSTPVATPTTTSPVPTESFFTRLWHKLF
jgi:hypothetical protein